MPCTPSLVPGAEAVQGRRRGRVPAVSDSSKRCPEGAWGSRLSTPARTGSACSGQPARAVVQKCRTSQAGLAGPRAVGALRCRACTRTAGVNQGFDFETRLAVLVREAVLALQTSVQKLN